MTSPDADPIQEAIRRAEERAGAEKIAREARIANLSPAEIAAQRAEDRADSRITGSGGRIDPEVAARRQGLESEEPVENVHERVQDARVNLMRGLRGEVPNDGLTYDVADPENVARSQKMIPVLRTMQVEGTLPKTELPPETTPDTIEQSRRASQTGLAAGRAALRGAPLTPPAE